MVEDEDATGDVRHIFWKIDQDSRVALLADVVSRHRSAIVFSRTKHGADRLVKQLGVAGVPAVAIHGNRSQPQRERALAQFSSGHVRALVATDVAARGIHVDDVGVVVHFDPPEDSKDYVHRSGRTGRAGAEGTVVSLVTHDKVRAVRLLQRSLDVPQEIGSPDVESLGDVVVIERRHVPAAPARTETRSDRPRSGDSRGRGPKARRQGGGYQGGQHAHQGQRRSRARQG